MIRPDTPYLALAELSRAWATERDEPRADVFRLLLEALWRGEFETEDADAPFYLHPKSGPPSWDANDPEDVDPEGYARVDGRTAADRQTRRDALARLILERVPMLRDLPEGALGDFEPGSPTSALLHGEPCCLLSDQCRVPPLDADWDALARIDWLRPEWKFWRQELFDPIALPRRTFGIWCEAVGFDLPRFWYPRGDTELSALRKQTKLAEKAREERCRRWLVSLMRAGPPEEGKGRPWYEMLARQTFRISLRGVDRAWRGAKEELGIEEWSPSGRKPSHH